jgi:septal ring factor EnvC (AmiA/AmiB activator)
MFMRGLVGLYLLIVFIPGPVLAAKEELDRTRRDLEQVRQQIESTSAELKDKKEAARKLARQLSQVDRDLRQARKKLDAARQTLVSLDQELTTQKKVVAEATSQSQDLESQVRKRLIVLYQGGETQLVKVLFSAQSPAAMAEDYDFFQRMVRKDRELLAEYRQLLDNTRQELARLDQLQSRHQETLTLRKQQESSLNGARQEKKKLLVRIRQDEEALAVLLYELEEKAARLTGLVSQLKETRSTTSSGHGTRFTKQQGSLSWPVTGPVRIGFGTGRHPELGTRYESHGIEIGVNGEVPIHAVWDGHVIFANPFRGYGNLLIIDHGEGYYSLYAQASRLTRSVGDRIERGEEIAVSGFEGAETVYFEIRKGGTPLDPMRWLAKKSR